MLKINYTDACNWVNKYLSHTKQKHWPTLCHKKSFFSGFTICITMHQDFSHPELRRWNNMQFPAKWAKVQKKRFFFFNSLGKQSRWPTEESQNFSCPVRCLHPARNQIYNRTDAFPECWEPKGEQTRKHRVNIHIRPKKKKNQLQSHKTNIITGNTVVCIFSLFFFLSWRRLQNNDLNTD